MTGEPLDPQGRSYGDALLTDAELIEKVERNIASTTRMAKQMDCPPPSFSMNFETAKRLVRLARVGLRKEANVVDVAEQAQIEGPNESV